jgi:superfamily II DNA/RNA helicase
VLEDEQSVEGRLGRLLDAETGDRAAAITNRMAEQIERLGGDSKLASFVALLNRLAGPDQASIRICIVTEYVATLFYIAQEVENHCVPCRLLHGRMSYEDRQTSIELSRSTGGVLAATSAALSQGIAMPDVTDLVFYDMPGGKVTLQQVLGRFDRFGRQTQLKIHAFLPSSDAFGTASESIQDLRQILGTRGEESE